MNGEDIIIHLVVGVCLCVSGGDTSRSPAKGVPGAWVHIPVGCSVIASTKLWEMLPRSRLISLGRSRQLVARDVERLLPSNGKIALGKKLDNRDINRRISV